MKNNEHLSPITFARKMWSMAESASGRLGTSLLTQAWYDSPAYREVREHRFRGADYRAVIIEGV